MLKIIKNILQVTCKNTKTKILKRNQKNKKCKLRQDEDQMHFTSLVCKEI